MGNYAYLVVEPPLPALVTSSEDDGVRLTEDPETPVAEGPVAVLPSGARMLTVHTYAFPPDWPMWDATGSSLLHSDVFRCDGPGHPWRQLTVDPARIRHGSEWFEVDGDTVGLNHSGDLDLLRLNPDGETFETVLSTPDTGTPTVARTLGRAMFVLALPSGPAQLLFSPDPLAQTPFVDVLTGVATRPGTVTARDVALVADDDEVFLVTHDPTLGSDHLRLHVFDTAGALVETSESLIPGLGLNERITTTSLGPDGSLYLWATGSQGVHRLLRSPDRMATLEVVASWDETWLPATALVTLSDGRLAFAATRKLSPEIWKAVVYTSMDGVTWSTPIMARADGGNGQRAVGISTDPEGGALVVLHDNGAMRAYSIYAPLDLTDYASDGIPWPDAVVVHLFP